MNIQCLIEAQHDIFHIQNWLTMMISIDGELLYQKVHTGNQREPVKRSAEDVKMVPECREWARRVYYGAEVVNYPDSYFLSPAPHATPPPLYCLPDEGLWSAKYSLLTLNCENNARVVVLTFPMLPHLNRPGYCFHRFQGKTLLEKEVPVFIKQLFRLPVISPPRLSVRRWLLWLGGYQQIWNPEQFKSHQGRPFERVCFRTERNISVRGSEPDVDALPQTHNSCCCCSACRAV